MNVSAYYGADMRTRKKTGSYAVGRARREAILDAAVERFKERGYHRTSMQDIADDVGLTPHGLLHHFCNQEGPALRRCRETIRPAVSGRIEPD